MGGRYHRICAETAWFATGCQPECYFGKSSQGACIPWQGCRYIIHLESVSRNGMVPAAARSERRDGGIEGRHWAVQAGIR
jgi:hypothetical protein